MASPQKRKLTLATVVYWVLLLYVITALAWWFFSLYTQSNTIYELQKKEINTWVNGDNHDLDAIKNQRKRNIAKYIGEGAAFLVLMLIGAVFIYRSVRRQLTDQQQQQNFVMAITHELKTPIAVSRLNLETLQRYKLDEAKKEKLLQMTLQETLRLDSLINNILISSQLDGNSYRLSKEELSLSDLVNDVACQFANRYPDRPFQKTIEDDIDIDGDPLLLKLLVSNLLENANKYSPRDQPVTLSLTKSERAVMLSIRDQGAGISEEEKRKIFRKFYRVGNEQTRKTKGTGLGLYLCKKIAQDHQGKISVDHNQPQGSNFTVSFPA